MTQTTENKDVSAGSSRNLLYDPKHRFVATGPNQIWTWGVTTYSSPDLKEKYYCYICEDIYSRCVVGYGLSPYDDVYSAVQILYTALKQNNITPDNGMVVYSNHGEVMQSLEMLSVLGAFIAMCYQKQPGTRIKPYLSHLFTTLNERLGLGSHYYENIHLCMDAVTQAVETYNNQVHSSLHGATPAQRHAGLDLQTVKDPETGIIKTID